MKQFNRFLFTILLFFPLYTIGYSQVLFSDNFDSYNAGEQLACQNGVDWTTWSDAPCTAEDAYVSDAYAHSGSNSFVVAPNNDQVHIIPDYTSGKYEVDCYTYIPSGASGYYNTMASFTSSYQWGFEVYFNADGTGDISAGGTQTNAFTVINDAWVFNQVVVDLDNDMAEFWYDGTMIYQWQWSLGASGNGCDVQLGASDFFGGEATDEMYVDDYQIIDLNYVPVIDFETVGNNWTWNIFSQGTNGSFAIVANPDPSGLNTSDSCAMLMVDADGDPWAGVWTSDFPDMTIDTTNCVVKLLVYKDVLSNFNLKLEPPNVDHNVPNTVTNQWQELTFDYSSDVGTTAATLTIIPDFPDSRDYASVNYFDNIRFLPYSQLPVELTSFTVSNNLSGQVVLSWQTATEINNRIFEIERKTGEENYATIGFVRGQGTSAEQHSYTFIDKNVSNQTYTYRLKQIDFDGSTTYSKAIEITAIGPKTFDLTQNYPNPFNPTTTISYIVPTSGFVTLAVYNTLGEQVALLVNGVVSEGSHTATFDAKSLPSGAYVYKLQQGNSVLTKKMMLMK